MAGKLFAGKIVFPANLTVEKSIADLPNKYIALLDPEEEAEKSIPEKVAGQSIDNIIDLWETILKLHPPTHIRSARPDRITRRHRFT